MAKRGRPSKYRPEMADQMVDFFKNFNLFDEIPLDKQDKDGNVTTTMKKVPNRDALPFFSDFYLKIGISPDTFNKWTKDPNKPEFTEAYKKCKKIYEKLLIKGGLIGLFSTPFAIFTAKNTIGWRDKLESDVNLRTPEPIIIKNDKGEHCFTLDLKEKNGN